MGMLVCQNIYTTISQLSAFYRCKRPVSLPLTLAAFGSSPPILYAGTGI